MTEQAAVSSSRFPAWTGKAAALAVLTACAAVAWWLGAISANTRAPSGGLFVAEDRLQMGDIWETNAFVWEVPIENRSDRTIEIVGFSKSCSCSKIEPPALTIPAGETAKVTITWNVLGRAKGDDPAGYAFEEQILPRLKDEPTTQPVWSLSGRVRRFWRVEPAQVEFTSFWGSGSSATTRVKVHTSLSMPEIVAESDKPLATIKVVRTAGSEQDCELEVTLKDNLTAGRHQFAITLRPGTHRETLPGTVSIPVIAMIRTEVQPTPISVLFGAIPVGEAREERVTLSSSLDRTFEVVRMNCSSADLSVSPIPGPLEEKARHFRIAQKISKKESQRGTVEFVVKDVDGREMTIPVQVTYYGLGSPATASGAESK